MSLLICHTGDEPAIREIIDYLDRRYRIPARDITAVAAEAQVGRPIQITVTVFQQTEEEVTEREVTALSESERIFLRSDGTYRTEPWHTPGVDVYAESVSVPDPLDASQWDDGTRDPRDHFPGY